MQGRSSQWIRTLDMIKNGTTIENEAKWTHVTFHCWFLLCLSFIARLHSFAQDCRDDDPMIRGLALRSLCSLDV